MPGLLVTPVNQWILALDRFHAGLARPERGEIGIILPELRTGRVYIGEELAGITQVQVADRRCEHYDVTRRLILAKNQLPHNGELERRGSKVPIPSRNLAVLFFKKLLPG